MMALHEVRCTITYSISIDVDANDDKAAEIAGEKIARALKLPDTEKIVVDDTEIEVYSSIEIDE